MTPRIKHICPGCLNETVYTPNPMYMHVCDCGHECVMDDLICEVEENKKESKRIVFRKSQINKYKKDKFNFKH